MTKVREPTLYYRRASVSVYVDDCWLTNGGEVSLAEGWSEIQAVLKALSCDHPAIGVAFERWASEPELASAIEARELRRVQGALKPQTGGRRTWQI